MCETKWHLICIYITLKIARVVGMPWRTCSRPIITQGSWYWIDNCKIYNLRKGPYEGFPLLCQRNANPI